MRAMTITEFGNTDVFKLQELPVPEVEDHQVLVKVAATSVNPVDTMIREMGPSLPIAPPLPAVLGMDFAGTIETVGSDVTGYAEGDEVYGCAGGLLDLPGALAEYMVVDPRLIAHKPKSLSMIEAAALPLVGITAYEGLQRAGVKSGQKVLVHGGSGGVGHIAVQLARHFGADVYATGGGTSQLAMIEKLGGTGINYQSTSVEEYVNSCTAGEGFDAIFDTVGGQNLINSMQAARLNGHISTTVALDQIDLSTAHFKGLSLHVVFMLIPMIYDQGRDVHGNILSEIAAVADKGELRPMLDEKRFSLQDTAAAHDRLTSGKAMGKVVVEI